MSIDECPICYEHATLILNYECNHGFCQECLNPKQPQKSLKLCPCCRANQNQNKIESDLVMVLNFIETFLNECAQENIFDIEQQSTILERVIRLEKFFSIDTKQTDISKRVNGICITIKLKIIWDEALFPPPLTETFCQKAIKWFVTNFLI
jgi:hypothetical protein